MPQTKDLRIIGTKEIQTPEALMQDLPLSELAANTVTTTRQQIYDVLDGKDDRLVVIIGPCSIHDTKAAHEYADRLSKLMEELNNELIIVMRVYFEKPRTTVGWKGLINDPDLDGSFHINKGVRKARELLLSLAEKGVPAGHEYLDLISPQYISDLVSWGAIGARTTESQGHRELASGLSCPVGFKNGTDGGVQVAIDAMRAAQGSHHFISITLQGHSAIFTTAGNEYSHVILRGGSDRPNYDRVSVAAVTEKLESSGLNPRLMIDTSHANSQKQFHKQIEVCRDIIHQIKTGQDNIFGLMIESHLFEGRQDFKAGAKLTYGQSITDACIGWEDSEMLLHELAEAVKAKRKTG
ncbi:MAG: 3-deoxy-7-phosphoheptulonate synthase [Gammaproteobacteria bacterium]|nr:3-deoxy-7-phosphoheptulonate synthase [Gammaproteobacteria bacterium]MDH3859577.1 3-deoxy-7-phosphoheptulonate synthase [Gammaproteobacteria bacterium]